MSSPFDAVNQFASLAMGSFTAYTGLPLETFENIKVYTANTITQTMSINNDIPFIPTWVCIVVYLTYFYATTRGLSERFTDAFVRRFSEIACRLVFPFFVYKIIFVPINKILSMAMAGVSDAANRSMFQALLSAIFTMVVVWIAFFMRKRKIFSKDGVSLHPTLAFLGRIRIFTRRGNQSIGDIVKRIIQAIVMIVKALFVLTITVTKAALRGSVRTAIALPRGAWKLVTRRRL